MITINEIADYPFYKVMLVDFKSQCRSWTQLHYEIIDKRDNKCYGICYLYEDVQPQVKSLTKNNYFREAANGT
jgi:hypothetical protein